MLNRLVQLLCSGASYHCSHVYFMFSKLILKNKIIHQKTFKKLLSQLTWW